MRELSNHLLLYSVNTELAYFISEKYYNNIHYVWCSPSFDSRGEDVLHRKNPPSSNPCQIYFNFKVDSENNDTHSAIIKQNRTGILLGASKKKEMGIITEEQEKEIITYVKGAKCEAFRPLLYIIPIDKVLKICKPVEVKSRANLFSKEYIIEELPRDFFDIIILEGR